MSEILLTSVARESGKTFASKSELAELRGYQSEWENAQRCINAHTDDKVRLAFQQHQEELRAAIARGDLDKMDGYGRAEFESEFAQKMEAGKAEKRRIAKAYAPLAAKIAERLAAVATDFASAQAKAEADAYSRFGVQYPGPSTLIAMLRRVADLARGKVPRAEYADHSPRQALPYLDL